MADAIPVGSARAAMEAVILMMSASVMLSSLIC